MSIRRFFSITWIVVLLTAFHTQTTWGAIEFQLLDHPNGGAQDPNMLGDEYGLRIDNSSGVQTFSFTPGVAFKFDPLAPQQATISGNIRHVQSNQIWGIEAVLQSVFIGNADGTDWRSNTSAPSRLYDGVVEDLQSNGSSAFGVSTNQLKKGTPAPSVPTDRLGFELVDVTLKLDAQLSPVFSLPNNSNDPNVINLDEFPNDTPSDDFVPFVISKGHRLDSTTDELVGVGWLEPSDDRGRAYTEDFLFVIGPPQPNSTGGQVPEPMSFLVWTMLGVCAYSTAARRSTRG